MKFWKCFAKQRAEGWLGASVVTTKLGRSTAYLVRSADALLFPQWSGSSIAYIFQAGTEEPNPTRIRTNSALRFETTSPYAQLEYLTTQLATFGSTLPGSKAVCIEIYHDSNRQCSDGGGHESPNEGNRCVDWPDVQILNEPADLCLSIPNEGY
jgi:hypothetical protein